MVSPDSHDTRTIFYGAVINPVSLNNYSILPQCLLSIGPSGKIEWMIDCVETHMLQETLASKGHIDVDIVFLNNGEFLMPGFIDTHTVKTSDWHEIYCPYPDPILWPYSTHLNFRSWERQSLSFSFIIIVRLLIKEPLHASRGNQYELLDWLEKLVFPLESQYKDEHFARKTYKSVVRRILSFGVRFNSA